MLIKLMTRYSRPLVACTILFASRIEAAQIPLALRCGCAMPIHGGFTVQIIQTSFGDKLAVLPFSKTETYDFYSAPLMAPVALTKADTAAADIYVRNTATQETNDFAVAGQMRFFDYNPASGSEVLIVETAWSHPRHVRHGRTVRLAAHEATVPADITVPRGHMIHIAMTVQLLSGTPGNFGGVLYNGPSDSSSAGHLGQNRQEALDWPLAASDPVGNVLAIYGIAARPDGCMCVSCSGKPGAAYSIQATSNLQSPAWTTVVMTNADANGLFSFVDADAMNHQCRFYRTAAH
jgi:hypothetical protein